MARSMKEEWKPINNFPAYLISSWGRIQAEKSGRILRQNANQYGVVFVGLFRNGIQYHRSVSLLVAKHFLPSESRPFDTPIHLDGDRFNNRVDNLMWRPRWFAVKYNRQFTDPYKHSILNRIRDTKTKEVSENSFECAKRYGLLESDVVMSILNYTFTWPTYQFFEVVID